mmetsp:Transcript_52174/g.150316  ORF Transcript_52174/g.150316 Transcript_52174/m.150316 type:complete len:110 (+) Transcript_52174:3-332(+)
MFAPAVRPAPAPLPPGAHDRGTSSRSLSPSQVPRVTQAAPQLPAHAPLQPQMLPGQAQLRQQQAPPLRTQQMPQPSPPHLPPHLRVAQPQPAAVAAALQRPRPPQRYRS